MTTTFNPLDFLHDDMVLRVAALHGVLSAGAQFEDSNRVIELADYVLGAYVDDGGEAFFRNLNEARIVSTPSPEMQRKIADFLAETDIPTLDEAVHEAQRQRDIRDAIRNLHVE